MTEGRVEPIDEGMKLIRQGDEQLMKGEFIKAAQSYAKAAQRLEGIHGEGANVAAGYHHLARAVDAYFAGRYADAIAAIEPAPSFFRGAGLADRVEFAQALQLLFESRLASENSEHRSAESLLASAEGHLNNVRAVSAELEAACDLWADWGRWQYLFHLGLDQADDDPAGEAVKTLDALKEALSRLKKRVQGQQGEPFYEAIGEWAGGVHRLGLAADAAENLDFDRATGFFDDTRRNLTKAREHWAKLRLPPGLADLEGHLLYFEGFADAWQLQVRGQGRAFAGDRVEAIKLVQHALKKLEVMRSDGRLEADRSDVEDDIRDATRLLEKLAAGDPGLLELEPHFRKLVETEFVDAVLQNVYELSNCVMQRHRLSALALAGGVLEALLLSALLRRRKDALACPRAPKNNGQTIPLENWKLNELLAVTEDLKLLPPGLLHLSNALRDFRNFIHPGKMARERYQVRDEDVTAAIAVLKRAVQQMSQTV